MEKEIMKALFGDLEDDDKIPGHFEDAYNKDPGYLCGSVHTVLTHLEKNFVRAWKLKDGTTAIYLLTKDACLEAMRGGKVMMAVELKPFQVSDRFSFHRRDSRSFLVYTKEDELAVSLPNLKRCTGTVYLSSRFNMSQDLSFIGDKYRRLISNTPGGFSGFIKDKYNLEVEVV